MQTQRAEGRRAEVNWVESCGAQEDRNVCAKRLCKHLATLFGKLRELLPQLCSIELHGRHVCRSICCWT